MSVTNLGPLGGALLAPLQSRPAGQATFGPETFPAGFTNFHVIVDLRQITSPTLVVLWLVQYSLDNGVTWFPNVTAMAAGIDMSQSGYTFDGTVFRNAEGGPVRATEANAFIPRSDIARLVRVTVSQSEPAILSALAFAW